MRSHRRHGIVKDACILMVEHGVEISITVSLHAYESVL